MRTTTFKCDKCGDECSGEDTIDLQQVNVVWGPYMHEVCQSKDWCLKCRKPIGACAQTREECAAFVPPTLEDMIRGIVREELPQE